MGFGIQNSAQGIHNLPAIGIWIQAPLRRNPESRVFNSESTTWNPQSKTGLDYLTSVGQHSFGTSNISPPFNSPAANHSPFIPSKLVIAIYMPKGQGVHIPGTFGAEERLTSLNQVTSEDNPRDSLVASQNVSYSARVSYSSCEQKTCHFFISSVGKILQYPSNNVIKLIIIHSIITSPDT